MKDDGTDVLFSVLMENYELFLEARAAFSGANRGLTEAAQAELSARAARAVGAAAGLEMGRMAKAVRKAAVLWSAGVLVGGVVLAFGSGWWLGRDGAAIEVRGLSAQFDDLARRDPAQADVLLALARFNDVRDMWRRCAGETVRDGWISCDPPPIWKGRAAQPN